MPIIKEIIHRVDNRKNFGKPLIIRWAGVPMIASQSVRVVADEIINMSNNQDLISINIIGKGGTGKSELARTLCCLIHSRSKLPYNVNYFSMKHMLDLEQTVKNLTP